MSKQSQLTVTVVTPSYNSEDTIIETLESIREQTYPHIEHIIMDGHSTDNTVAIARRYEPHVTVISEPDTGQSNAINKGWKMAIGDLLVWLNADDRYLPDTIEKAVNYFETHPTAMWLYGMIQNIDTQENIFPIRTFDFTWDYEHLLKNGNYITQPTTFIRRELLDEFGFLDEDLHYGMDYDFWLRIGKVYEGHFVPEVRAQMIRFREAKSEQGGVARIEEMKRITARHGYDDLPSAMHTQWVQAFMIRGAEHFLHGRIAKALSDWRNMLNYPKPLPHALFKVLLVRLLPYKLESQLRRLALRTQESQ